MSNPTTPFSWQMPTATDLVTDLPADFEVFGQAVATSMADLLGGTTGQVLAKASGTDMDFVWQADAGGMANPMTTTGDTIYSSPGSTPVRRAIGTTGQVLTVAGGIPTWATPAGGGKVLQVVSANWSTIAVQNSNTYADTGLTATITPTSASSKILVLVTHNGNYRGDTAGNIGLSIRLLRTATVLADSTNLGYTATSLQQNFGAVAINYLDSPSTTSAITYKTEYRNYFTGALGYVSVQYNSDLSTIVLMEIGA